MTKDYFSPVKEFRKKKEPKKQSPEEEKLPNLKKPIKQIKSELTLIYAGESKYSSGASYYEKGKTTLFDLLDKVERLKTRQTIETFLKITNQDLGRTVSLAFEDIFAKVYPSIKDKK